MQGQHQRPALRGAGVLLPPGSTPGPLSHPSLRSDLILGSRTVGKRLRGKEATLIGSFNLEVADYLGETGCFKPEEAVTLHWQVSGLFFFSLYQQEWEQMKPVIKIKTCKLLFEAPELQCLFHPAGHVWI